MSSHIRLSWIRLAAVFALLMAFTSSAAIAQQMNIRAMRVFHYSTQSDEAYAKADWERAIFYRELVANLAPLDHLNYYNLACCYALDGQTDKAFEALDNSIRYGWCDTNHIKRDTDLDSLRDDDRYQTTLQSADECNRESQFVHEPASAKNNKSVELLIALCGFGGNPREFGHAWIPVADQLGVPVVALKGRGETGSNGVYGWHKGQNPRDLDIEGTAQLIDDAIEKRGVDPAKVIIVGFSQGGAVALKLMAEHPEKYRGAVTIAGGKDPEVFGNWIANAENSKPRVFMIAGVLDKNRPHGEPAMQPIVDAGIRFKYELLPQVGHEMPVDSTNLYVEAIEFLTEDG
ncbi:MAG: hypothetical protein DHS20C16_12170 [Phycisphaerae bacterium]|nr:MAG: hypothetical protein DHS20C16_12170 [Phycisphaerae bacterium]